ncbi:MAG TPA: chromate transporter [Halanaerobiaceae bacterium]|jgi:chromate transporter|nr:chromate transporter [Bacillota bacterium]HHU93443.1 chromate transporter [Halanaerobiaceae bacterium]HOA39984.1 chromate transporter [Halanaerobiales bacterium]HPZ62060.1 chromate transporter [Halanaerobiales bacterium]HQD03443.1 chromate transporter [Halanaerobiales bacterium]
MLRVLLELFLSFFKIGFFGFGGGYAMISLIQNDLKAHGWLSLEEFVNIIAIAEMTPGPIAINSGTYVGFKVAGLAGSIVASLAVVVPSFMLVLLLAHFYDKVRGSDYIIRLLFYLRPILIALVFAAAISVARTSIMDFKSIIIVLAALFLLHRVKVHPVMIIVLAGLSGLFLYP